MYKIEEVTGKTRKTGGEAPSARVFKSESDELIIGMMAENVKFLTSIYSLTDQASKDIIIALENKFAEVKKLNFIIVVNNSFEEIEEFKACNNITKATITQDKNGDFAKRFGVGLEGENFSQNIANGIFVIDKEAELKAVEYFMVLDYNKLNELYDITMETVNFKPKGHTHENWMGV